MNVEQKADELAAYLQQGEDARVRLSCAIVLMSVHVPAVDRAYLHAIGDSDEKIVPLACLEVGDRGGPESAAALFRMLEHPQWLLILLPSAPDGTVWIFLLCAVIFAGDTAALYAGTLWGRHKLCPAISPGKTVEGALAGLAANLAVGMAGTSLFLPKVGWAAALAFAVAVGLAGQVGDLFESEWKRASNVKDSGGLLPGHGGVLDPIDALLVAAPVGFVLRMTVVSA